MNSGTICRFSAAEFGEVQEVWDVLGGGWRGLEKSSQQFVDC